MGHLSLTCFEADLERVLPLLESGYDWARHARLAGDAPSLEEAANAPRRGCAVILGERSGRTMVFDREVEPLTPAAIVAMSEEIAGVVVTGYHQSVTGGTTLAVARSGTLLCHRVSEPETPEADVDEGEPLASEAEWAVADGSFDSVVHAAESLGFDWTGWEREGPFHVMADEEPEEEPVEVLKIDPNARRPGIWKVLSWLLKVRRDSRSR